MTTYLYISDGLFLMFKLILQKSKVPLGGLSQLYVFIIECSPTFSYHLRRLARLCISDTRAHNEHQRLSAQHPKGHILKQNLKTHIIKKCQIYEKLGILGGFLTKLGKPRSTFEILGKSRKTRNAGKPAASETPFKWRIAGMPMMAQN